MVSPRIRRQGLRRVAAATLAAATLAAGLQPVYAQQDATSARLERIERMLDNKGLAELVRQLEALQQEVRQLQGELENQNFALEQLRKGQRDVYNNLDQRVGTLEQAGVISLPAGGLGSDTAGGPGGEIPRDPPLAIRDAPGDIAVAGTPSTDSIAIDAPVADSTFLPLPGLAPDAGALPGSDPAPDARATDAALGLAEPGMAIDPLPADTRPAPAPTARSAAATTDSPASETAYREAFGLLKTGKYDDSIAAFDAFLAQYPRSQYADNAQYWLGEAYYVKGEFESAIEQYQTLVNDYPDSQKQSHALLKIAYSYSELGLDEQALSVLATLRTRFPGTAAARLADERIQRLRVQVP